MTLTLAMGLPGLAIAGPREDVKDAYATAMQQFHELELDSAVSTLDKALGRARKAGLNADPMLAPLLVLRGGLIYAQTGDQSRTVASFQAAVEADYHVELPIELRSEEIEILLEQARTRVPTPRRGAIEHDPPSVVPGQDITLAASSAMPLSGGVTMTLRWRRAGSDTPFTAVELDTFGSLGTATIPASRHGDAGLEYFFSVHDGEHLLASHGTAEAPRILEPSRGPSPRGGRGGKDSDGKGSDSRRLRRTLARAWPRLYLNLGIGTGVGISHGVAELSYEQYDPAEYYSPTEQACAIARWYAGDGEVPASPDQFVRTVDPSLAPGGDLERLHANYDPERCAQRHPVDLGIASAPLHLAPEVMVRVHERDIGERRSLAVLIGAFGRLQLITGSRVFTDDPTEERELSFHNQARSSMPRGIRHRPGFTWAAGVKLAALITKRGGKLHGKVGIFGGYGRSRLRVDLRFSNDRNGNSVPDEYEAALSGSTDDRGTGGGCTPVWPYNNGCTPGSDGDFDDGIAQAVRISAPKDDRRIDTVRLGPAFAGVLLGFHYQPFKHFGVFGELDVGGWFPDAGSLLVDINVGPSITF